MNFETTVVWKEEFPGKILCQNGQVIDYSPPAELQGMRGPLTPEDAFVAALNTCYMFMFIWSVERLKIDLVRIDLEY